MSLNAVALVGRLVRDVEKRTTNTGKSVVEATLAVEKRFKPQNDGDPKADFLRVKLWGQQADFLAEYGGKGRLCAVSGRIETRAYNDKDGNKREVVEIVADQVSLLDKPKDEGGEARSENSPNGGQQGSGGGYSSTPRSGGGAGQRPAAQPSRGNVPNADEYDPFADE